MSKYYVHVILGLSVFGFVDAAYLSYTRFTHSSLSCNIFDGCNVVAASEYSVLFGLFPLAYLGLLFYGVIMVLAFIVYVSQTPIWRKLLFLSTTGGLVSSAYFIYIQAVFIKAFCIYCIISAIIATVLFIVAGLYMHKMSSQKSVGTPVDVI